jgi:hypothetical protein
MRMPAAEALPTVAEGCTRDAADIGRAIQGTEPFRNGGDVRAAERQRCHQRTRVGGRTPAAHSARRAIPSSCFRCITKWPGGTTRRVTHAGKSWNR